MIKLDNYSSSCELVVVCFDDSDDNWIILNKFEVVPEPKTNKRNEIALAATATGI